MGAAAAIVPFSSVQRLMFAVKSETPGAARASADPIETRAIAAVKGGDSRPIDFRVRLQPLHIVGGDDRVEESCHAEAVEVTDDPRAR